MTVSKVYWGWAMGGWGVAVRVGERRAAVGAHGAGCYASMVVVACSVRGGCDVGLFWRKRCFDGDGCEQTVQGVG